MHPGANRVYAQSAPVLGLAELTICLPGARDVRPEIIAGRDYITFSADDSVDAIARLSVAFALFTREGGALVPVALPVVERYDDDLLSIPRYTGKTNESFTKLLLNITAAQCATSSPSVLDPMAGRGTTMHHAVLYGWDATGVEIDKKDCEAYRSFFTTWLKTKRLPHKARDEKQRFRVEFAPERAAFDAGDGQTAIMINGDSRDLDLLLKKNAADLIVSDLPYGVRHGSEGPARQRSPLSLVEECIDGWARVLRPNGAMGLAFNTMTCPRADLIALCESAGFDVCDEPAYLTLEHRVDQSINRDVVISRRR